MKLILTCALALACLGLARTHTTAMPVDSLDAGSPQIHLAGNTSSNSSSNTSSDSGSRGSSYVHTHRWSLDSDDGRRRRVTRGSTRIERYAPARRHSRERRYRRASDD